MRQRYVPWTSEANMPGYRSHDAQCCFCGVRGVSAGRGVYGAEVLGTIRIVIRNGTPMQRVFTGSICESCAFKVEDQDDELRLRPFI